LTKSGQVTFEHWRSTARDCCAAGSSVGRLLTRAVLYRSCVTRFRRHRIAQARLVVLKGLTFEFANILRGAAMTRYTYHSPSWRRHTRTTSQSSSNRIHSGVFGIRKSCGIDCAGISAGAPPSASPAPGNRMTLTTPGMRHPRTTAGTPSSNECGFVGSSVMRSQPPNTNSTYR
jgi:hypothetical protein